MKIIVVKKNTFTECENNPKVYIEDARNKPFL